MREAVDGAREIRGANDEDWQFSYVDETFRAKHYAGQEIMPVAYYC
jgi:hypothetical protein